MLWTISETLYIRTNPSHIGRSQWIIMVIYSGSNQLETTMIEKFPFGASHFAWGSVQHQNMLRMNMRSLKWAFEGKI
jgi:hypothetical protein